MHNKTEEERSRERMFVGKWLARKFKFNTCLTGCPQKWPLTFLFLALTLYKCSSQYLTSEAGVLPAIFVCCQVGRKCRVLSGSNHECFICAFGESKGSSYNVMKTVTGKFHHLCCIKTSLEFFKD